MNAEFLANAFENTANLAKTGIMGSLRKARRYVNTVRSGPALKKGRNKAVRGAVRQALRTGEARVLDRVTSGSAYDLY